MYNSDWSTTYGSSSYTTTSINYPWLNDTTMYGEMHTDSFCLGPMQFNPDNTHSGGLCANDVPFFKMT